MGKFSIVLASLTLFLVGCGPLKKLDDMLDATESLENTSNNISKTSDKLKNGTDTMYLQVRSKEAQETRDRSIENIQRDTDDNGNYPSFEYRISQGVFYHASFEYQLWSARDHGGDDAQHYDHLKKESVEEYMRALAALLKQDKFSEFSFLPNQQYSTVSGGPATPEEIAEGKSKLNPRKDAIMALAATLHRTHSYQDSLSSKGQVNKVSMKSMFIDALKDRKNILEGKLDPTSLGESRLEIMTPKNFNFVQEMLQLRVNAILGIAWTGIFSAGKNVPEAPKTCTNILGETISDADRGQARARWYQPEIGLLTIAGKPRGLRVVGLHEANRRVKEVINTATAYQENLGSYPNIHPEWADIFLQTCRNIECTKCTDKEIEEVTHFTEALDKFVEFTCHQKIESKYYTPTDEKALDWIDNKTPADYWSLSDSRRKRTRKILVQEMNARYTRGLWSRVCAEKFKIASRAQGKDLVVPASWEGWYADPDTPPAVAEEVAEEATDPVAEESQEEEIEE